MKKLLALALVALMAGSALAQAPEIGMFFSDTEFTQETANIASPAGPFNGYVVLLGSDLSILGGYEVGIAEDSGGTLFALSVTGPNGWTNFGSNFNHLVGFQTPLPVVPEGVVLSTVQMLYSGTDVVTFTMGASNPNSIDDHDGPVIADGSDPNNLVACWTTGGAPTAPVASVNGQVVAVEAETLTGVKALFQ